MRKIEGDQTTWTNIGADRVISQRMNYGSHHAGRRVAAGYQTATEQVNQTGNSMSGDAGVNHSSLSTPEYQNDITDRRYEIASWLQEIGTIEDTSMADVVGENHRDMAGMQAEVIRRFDSASKQTQEMPEEEETEAGKQAQETVPTFQEEKEAEDELASLKAMLDSLQRRKKRAVTVKKTLPYSYQRVSMAIRGAKTVLQASNALSTANSSLSLVRRQAATGKYSEKEISIAKNHARKMVRTARKKLRHLKAEVSQKYDGDQVKNHAKQKMNTVAATAHDRQKQELQRQKNQELFKLSKEIQRTEKRYKNKHRRKENWALMEADLEYLRRRIEYLKNQEERQENMGTPDTAYGAASEDTKIFTANEQSVILESESVVETTVKGNES